MQDLIGKHRAVSSKRGCTLWSGIDAQNALKTTTSRPKDSAKQAQKIAILRKGFPIVLTSDILEGVVFVKRCAT